MTTNPFVETGCTFDFEGKTFESGGAVITPEYIVAYLGKGCQLTDWKGNRLGAYAITSTWKTPRSYVLSEMHQVWALLDDGSRYTGRSAGIGMIFKGKRTNT